MFHSGSVPILLVKRDFKSWPSRIRGQIIPTLFTQQSWVLPFISSKCFSISCKMNFISLSQTSTKCLPCSIHCKVPCSFELWFEYLVFLFASPVPLVTALWQQNIFTCYPVTAIWSPISFYSINIFSALVPGQSSAGSVINGSSIMGPHYLACLGCGSMESCCGFPLHVCCRWVFALTAAPGRFSPDIAHRLLSTTGSEGHSCLHWGDRLSLKLNHHSWGKIYWIMNNPFLPPLQCQYLSPSHYNAKRHFMSHEAPRDALWKSNNWSRAAFIHSALCALLEYL